MRKKFRLEILDGLKNQKEMKEIVGIIEMMSKGAFFFGKAKVKPLNKKSSNTVVVTFRSSWKDYYYIQEFLNKFYTNKVVFYV